MSFDGPCVPFSLFCDILSNISCEKNQKCKGNNMDEKEKGQVKSSQIFKEEDKMK